jgi:YihY family inner membrane protein
MATVAQGWTRRGRDLAQTWLARALQLTSQLLGTLSPRAQTRLVRWIQIALEIHVKSREEEVSVRAAALTYNAFLSIPPLMLVGLSITGFLISDADVSAWVDRALVTVPGLQDLVQQQLATLREARTTLGLVGLVGALWLGTTLASRTQTTLALIFAADSVSIVNRVRAVAVSIALGIALLATLGASSFVSGLTAEGLIEMPLHLVIRVALAALLFGFWILAYRLLGPTELAARDHLSGAVWMTIGFEVLWVLGGWYVGNFVARASALYGAIGAVFGVLIFIRLAMWLFLYGAEISSIVLRERDAGRAASGEAHVRRDGLKAGDAHGEELVER